MPHGHQSNIKIIPLAYARGSDWFELRGRHLPGDCDRIRLENTKMDRSGLLVDTLDAVGQRDC